MQCSQCGASRMKLANERNFLNVYLIRNWQCERCGSSAKELKAMQSGDTRVVIPARSFRSVPSIV